jgi:thiamine biosynthesis lipoprotein ApbE
MLLISSSDIPSKSEFYVFDYENVLGTSFTLKVSASSETTAGRAEEAALNEIDRLSAILSTYDPSSEFSQWQRTYNTDVPVSEELFEVLSLFDRWEARTDGALNASAAVAAALWNSAAKTNDLPGPEELSEAVSAMEKTHWTLNEETRTARRLSNDPLVLNTFVKSYIISKASEEVMDIPGVSSAVLNIGGDMLVSGERAEKINVTDPLAYAENDNPLTTLNVSGKAVATSGNYRRGFSIGDEWYSHIIDPRTAQPAQEVISATVVAENATDAGALATTLNILSPSESEALAKQIPDAEYLIITESGEKITSDGWDELEIKSEEVTNEAVADYEVDILFELTRFQGRSPRPYVAIWVENEKSEPVRTLALWFNNYRWLPDLRRWYTKHYEMTQKYDFMTSVTSATRSAGQYTVKWDGLDQQGEPLKSGRFTIYIEVSREHGTYQLLKEDIELNKKPQKIELEGGVEVASAAIDYHKVETN